MLKVEPGGRADRARRNTVTGRAKPLGLAAATTLAAAAIAGCTITDSLIPPNPIPETRPADAPGYAMNATPMNPATNDAETAMPRPAPAGPVQSAPLSAPAASAPPARTLPPRAAASSGRAAAFPAANETRHPDRPPRLRQEAALPPKAEPPAAPAPAAPAPARETHAAIRFTPVIGAPVSAITPLSEQLEKSAERRGLTIRNTADKPVDNILRGYFSAEKEGNHTKLVYMWDILDPDGTQLHRIEGTVTLRGGHGKPWATIPDDTMKMIARKTISAYLDWRTSKAG